MNFSISISLHNKHKHTHTHTRTHTHTQDMSDETFAKRHEKCETGEKKRFLNFISGGQRKRSRPQSLASTPDGSVLMNSPKPFTSKGKQQRKTLVSPTLAMEMEPSVPEVLPWCPRVFPLGEKDLDALQNPVPPPPPLRITPVHLSSSFSFPDMTTLKSHTPLSSSSTLATPLSTPPSTPSDELPSPSEWVVTHNTHTVTKCTSSSQGPAPHPNHIILKLSKKC